MSDAVETIRVKRDEAGLRLDRWFKIHFPDVTYGYLQKLLRSGQVRVNSKRVEGNVRLESGQEIRVPKVARQKPGRGQRCAEPQAASRDCRRPTASSSADDPVRGRRRTGAE